MVRSVVFKNSDRADKRLMAIFYVDGQKVKTTHFGQRNPTGRGAYPDHKDDRLKRAWIARHSVRGTFNNPMSASSLARWVLWNKTSISASKADYKRRFRFK